MTKVVSSNREQELSVFDWLGCCCGASVNNNPSPKTKFNNAGKGIRVFPGKHHHEYDSGKSYLSHVETSAGPLTIVIKYAD